MKKELPNIFKGKVTRNLNQKETIINKEEKINEENTTKGHKNINKQIKDIFNSETFIYKADTLITLKTGEKLKKTIIGKNNNSLITMDDELIDISSIELIELI